MTIPELLKEYMTTLGCSQSELAEASGITPAALSYYMSSQRIPKRENVAKLAEGIASVAEKKGIDGVSCDEVYERIFRTSGYTDIEPEQFGQRFSSLVSGLKLNLSKLAKYMDIDASLLSKIKQGERLPSNTDLFISQMGSYLYSQFSKADELSVLNSFLGNIPEGGNTDRKKYITALESYFLSSASNRSSSRSSGVNVYLRKLDDFDLNEYTTIIKFDKLKVPTAPLTLPASKRYYGIEQMKQGELDFLRATAVSRSKQPFFMNSDMPMADMARDLEFGKKWMFGIAACIKKGLHLNIIHSINRGLDEMVLGLEAWIPIYMTGQVTPYYIPDYSASVFHHLIYVSGAAALTGECISGHHADGMYYLTNSKAELAYCRKRSEDILSKALPLMDIYDAPRRDEFMDFIASEAQTEGERRNMRSTLPIYTISDELFERILRRNGIPKEQQQTLTEYLKKARSSFIASLAANKVTDIIPLPRADSDGSIRMKLSLSGAFYEREVYYSPEEYAEHYEQTRQLAEDYRSYDISPQSECIFRNIQIKMKRGEWVMVSKAKSPAIHFIIRHPKIINAIDKTLCIDYL